MTNIRTQREERAEGVKVPVFGLLRAAFVMVRDWLTSKRPKRRYYEAPRPEKKGVSRVVGGERLPRGSPSSHSHEESGSRTGGSRQKGDST